MPIRIPLKTVIVQRDGKSYSPKIGEKFTFTDGELKEIMQMQPDAVRKPINEEASAVSEAPVADKTVAQVTADKTGGKGGKTGADKGGKAADKPADEEL